MSLFKEKDEFIKNIFNHLRNDSDDEEAIPGGGDSKEENIHSSESKQAEAEVVKQEQSINTAICKKARLSTSGESNASSPDIPPKSKNRPKKNRPSKLAIDDVTSTSDILCITLSDESANHDHDLITISDSDDGDIEGLSERFKASNPTVESANSSPSIEVRLPNQNNRDVEQETQDLDRDYNLKIIMDSTYKSYKTTYSTKLSVAVEPLLNDLKKAGKNLVLALKGQEVSLDQTPASLHLESGSLLKAIIVNNQPANPETISVKLQDGNRKHNKIFDVAPGSSMSDLKKKYLEEYKLDASTKIKLMFDGEVVDDEATPEELDIDDGCVIDVMFC